MTDEYTWIPLVGFPDLPEGYYWLRDTNGKEWVQRLDPLWTEHWMFDRITHYCPVPRPLEPQQAQEGA